MTKEQMKKYVDIYMAANLLTDNGYMTQEQYAQFCKSFSYDIVGRMCILVNKQEKEEAKAAVNFSTI